jgi:hypothetical protein
MPDKPGLLETANGPGEECIEMASHAGHGRESQDRILARDEEAGLGVEGDEGQEDGVESDKSDTKATPYPVWLRREDNKISQRHSSPGAFHVGRGEGAV